MTDKEPYELAYAAEDIDNKLKNIPLEAETNWERKSDWKLIADQNYSDVSEFAQSGKAVAAAISDAEARISAKYENITVDASYNPDSSRAQSGRAVKSAIKNAIDDAVGTEGVIGKELASLHEIILSDITVMTTQEIEAAFLNSDDAVEE